MRKSEVLIFSDFNLIFSVRVMQNRVFGVSLRNGIQPAVWTLAQFDALASVPLCRAIDLKNI